jgi:hypothetical protein
VQNQGLKTGGLVGLAKTVHILIETVPAGINQIGLNPSLSTNSDHLKLSKCAPNKGINASKSPSMQHVISYKVQKNFYAKQFAKVKQCIMKTTKMM